MNTPAKFTIDQYASFMRVSRRTVVRWIDRKQLTFENVAPAGSTRRMIRIPANAVVVSFGNKPKVKETVLLPRAKKVHV